MARGRHSRPRRFRPLNAAEAWGMASEEARGRRPRVTERDVRQIVGRMILSLMERGEFPDDPAARLIVSARLQSAVLRSVSVTTED